MKKLAILCSLFLIFFALPTQELEFSSQGQGIELQKLVGGDLMNSNEEKLGDNLIIMSVKMSMSKPNNLLGAMYFMEYFAVQSRDTTLSPEKQIKEIKKTLKQLSARFAVRRRIFGGNKCRYNDKIVAVPVKLL